MVEECVLFFGNHKTSQMFFRSSRLFPWGFAKKSGFGLTTTSTLPSVLKFDLSPAFTNQRSNVFRENRKRFMINSWLKRKHFNNLKLVN